MRATTLFNTLLHLEGVTVTGVRCSDDDVRLAVRRRRKPLVWPQPACGYTTRGRGEMNKRAAFCKSVEKAKEVISTAVTDFARTGRTAM